MNYKEKQVTHFDNLTGEITQDTMVTSYESKIPNEPPYIKLYTTDIGHLCGLTAGAIRVLMSLVSRVDYDGELSLPRGVREKITKELGVSLGVINNAITELTQKEVLKRVGTKGSGLYELNPNLFARGKWKDIYEKRKTLKITITYKDKGKNGKREIVTEQVGGDVVPLFSESENTDSSNTA